MRIHAGSIKDVWPEIVHAAAYLLKRTLTRRKLWKHHLSSLQASSRTAYTYMCMAALPTHYKQHCEERQAPRMWQDRPPRQIGCPVGRLEHISDNLRSGAAGTASSRQSETGGKDISKANLICCGEDNSFHLADAVMESQHCSR
nr:hypothetical protein CFP56_02617 [Quercus suber]